MIKNIISCNTNCYRGSSFDRALKGIAGSGLKYVEISAVPGHIEHVSPELLDSRQMKDIRKKVEGYGLEPSSISGHCNLASKEGAGLFMKRIDLASEIGVGFVNTAEGVIKSEKDKDDFFDNMKDLSGYAEKKGVTICLETHGGILGNGKECRKTLERIGSESVKINYDPANLIYFKGERPEDDIGGIVDKIGHFHIKDKLEGQGVWNFPAIGDGYIDFSVLFDILIKKGYKGPLSFEIEFLADGPGSPEEVDLALSRSIKHVMRILGSIDQH